MYEYIYIYLHWKDNHISLDCKGPAILILLLCVVGAKYETNHFHAVPFSFWRANTFLLNKVFRFWCLTTTLGLCQPKVCIYYYY